MKGGELVPEFKSDEVKARLFKQTLAEGTRVEVFMDRIVGNDRTLAQLAKAHAVIRQLADETGQPFESIKRLVKDKAGLFTTEEDGSTGLKSFGDCSREELSRAIETCIEFGSELGIALD
jgi:hypothetical protein